MDYQIDFKPRAVKDLKDLPKAHSRRVMARIEVLRRDLAGDVKKLTNFTPEYRLRVGDYRVLFEVEGGFVVVYRVLLSKRGVLMAERRMLKLHPEILVKDGKKQFAVLPYDEYLAIQERLADADDLLELRKAKRAEGKKRFIPLAQVKRELGLR